MIKIRIKTSEIELSCSDEYLKQAGKITTDHDIPNLVSAVKEMITSCCEATTKIINEKANPTKH